MKSILAFFAALPEIVRIIRDLLDFLKETKDRAERKELAKAVRDGIHKAAKEHDTSDLEKLFRP